MGCGACPYSHLLCSGAVYMASTTTLPCISALGFESSVRTGTWLTINDRQQMTFHLGEYWGGATASGKIRGRASPWRLLLIFIGGRSFGGHTARKRTPPYAKLGSLFVRHRRGVMVNREWTGEKSCGNHRAENFQVRLLIIRCLHPS